MSPIFAAPLLSSRLEFHNRETYLVISTYPKKNKVDKSILRTGNYPHDFWWILAKILQSHSPPFDLNARQSFRVQLWCIICRIAVLNLLCSPIWLFDIKGLFSYMTLLSVLKTFMIDHKDEHFLWFVHFFKRKK